MMASFRLIVALTAAYLVIGAVLMGVTYSLTGVDPGYINAYEPEVINAIAKLKWIPDVAVGFMMTHFPVAILIAVILALCSAHGRPGWLLMLAGVGVSVLFEIAPLPGRSFDGSWLHMLWVVARTWPEVPDWVLPAGRLLRTAASYLMPPALTGLILGLWLAARNRRPRSSSVEASKASPSGTEQSR